MKSVAAFIALAVFVSSAAATPATGPVCGFTQGYDSGAYYGQTVSQTIALNTLGNPTITETLAISGSNFVITLDYTDAPGVLVPYKTKFQFGFFPSPDDANSETNGNCDPFKDGALWYYVEYDNTSAISTLPSGSSVAFTSTLITITLPIRAPAYAFLNVPLTDLCDQGKLGGAQLLLRSYNIDELDTEAAPGSCDDDISLAGNYLPFFFTCNCRRTKLSPPPNPALSPSINIPPPGRHHNPPPCVGPCGLTGADGITRSTVSKYTEIGGEPNGLLESITLSGSTFIITLDFSASNFVATDFVTAIQFGFFESLANFTTWAAGPGQSCTPIDQDLYFYVVWANTTNDGSLPAGTTITFTTTSVTIVFPFITKSIPYWYQNICAFCLHNKPGGAQFAVRFFERGLASYGTYPNCIEDSDSTASDLAFSFACTCTAPPPNSSPSIDIPPPNRAQHPPPAPCPVATSGPCGFLSPMLEPDTYHTFPLSPSGSVVIGLGLNNVTGADYFNIYMQFNGFTPVPGSTKIQYRFFEGFTNPIDGIDAYLQSSAASTCDSSLDGLLYTIRYGTSTTVYGYTAPSIKPTVSYPDSKTVTIVAPLTDASFPQWNIPPPAICCHQKDNGTVLAFRIFTATVNEQGTAPCGDALPVTSGYFNFVLSCNCPFRRRML